MEERRRRGSPPGSFNRERNLAVRKLGKAFWALTHSSVLWGCLGSAGFFTLIHNDVLPGSKLLVRYTAREWVQYVETIFFFIGIAELLLKTFDLTDQRNRLRKSSLLGERAAEPVPVEDIGRLIERLKGLPGAELAGYYPRRLREALETFLRRGSVDTLDDELKYLSEADNHRSHSGFAFMRIVIWSIPIWGFLGTVLGITDAIASLDPKVLETSLGHVTQSLGGVFDTTALALALSIGLMFAQYFVDRREGQLLVEIDRKISDDLTGRFQSASSGEDPQLAIFERTMQSMIRSLDRDPQVAVLERMSQAIVHNSERLVERQAEIWQKTIEAAHLRWSELTANSQQQLEAALGKSLARSVQAHAEHLATAEAAAAERNRRHWNRLHKAIVESTEIAQSQHVELVKQSEVLLQVVEATGQVTKLEDTLNRNLAALAGAQHFQETLLNLSAAIHLLNARLGQVAPARPQVALKDRPVGEAA
jgi:biopolymer transport protein ExbB/TolQ